MEVVLILVVCPKCLSWQTGDNCSDCGTKTCLPGTCSKCGLTSATKFCGECGGALYGTLADNPKTPEVTTITYTPTPALPLNQRPSVFGGPVATAAPPRVTTAAPPRVTTIPPAAKGASLPKRSSSQSQVSSPYIGNSGPQTGQSLSARPAVGVTDTASIFGSGVRPSVVVKGKAGGQDEDPLAKYRVKPAENEESVDDWNKALRNASRAQVPDDASVATIYKPSQPEPPRSVAPSVPSSSATVRPSEVLRGREEDGLSKYRVQDPAPLTSSGNDRTGLVRRSSATIRPSVLGPAPPSASSSSLRYPPQTVVAAPTIKPSVMRDASDGLEKYRIKPTSHGEVAEIPTLRPSILKDTSDPLEKYRVKSPEEEERTWEIHLRNLPATFGKPVEFLAEENLLASGEGQQGFMSAMVTSMCTGTETRFVLKIHLLNFHFTRSLEIGKGRFVRFAVEQGQMKFRQQKMPFTD